MKTEHCAWQVADSAAVADWYAAHLGLKTVRSGPGPANGRFLADSTGRVLLEIYTHPAIPVPDYRQADPLTLHLAFCVDDVKAHSTRLIAAGATVQEALHTTPSGDEMVMLRDP